MRWRVAAKFIHPATSAPPPPTPTPRPPLTRLRPLRCIASHWLSLDRLRHRWPVYRPPVFPPRSTPARARSVYCCCCLWNWRSGLDCCWQIHPYPDSSWISKKDSWISKRDLLPSTPRSSLPTHDPEGCLSPAPHSCASSACGTWPSYSWTLLQYSKGKWVTFNVVRQAITRTRKYMPNAWVKI